MPPIQPEEVRVIFKTGSYAQWSETNPTPLLGEFCIVQYANAVFRIKVGDGVRTFNQLPFYQENGGSYQGFALPDTVPNISSGAVWYFATQGIYPAFPDEDGNPISVEGALAIISYNDTAGYFTSNELFGVNTYIEIQVIIRIGGTEGVNCDFNTLTRAMQLVGGPWIAPSPTNRYVMFLIGDAIEAGQAGSGINIIDWVEIVGIANVAGAIPVIKGPSAPNLVSVTGYACIRINANSIIRNCYIQGFENLGIVTGSHATDRYGTTMFENCVFDHLGGFGVATSSSLNAQVKYSRKLILHNCRDYSNTITVANANLIADRASDHACTIIFEGCTLRGLSITDYLMYAKNRVQIMGCNIGTLSLDVDLSTYNGNVGNPLANKGFVPPLMYIEEKANRIKKLVEDADYISLANDHMENRGIKLINGMNKLVSNSGATIAEGIAMVSTGFAPPLGAYANTAVGRRVCDTFAKYAGAGKVEGFSMAAIPSGENGPLQTTGYIKAAFNTANGAVVLNDALELNNNGEIQKKSAGATVGFARGANSGGFVELEFNP